MDEPGKLAAHYDGTTHIEVIDIRTAAGAGAVVHSGEGVKSMIEFPGSVAPGTQPAAEELPRNRSRRRVHGAYARRRVLDPDRPEQLRPLPKRHVRDADRGRG